MVDCFGFIRNLISTICVAHLRRSTTTDDDDDDELPHLPQTPANSAAHTAHNKRRDKIFCSVRPINTQIAKRNFCVRFVNFIYINFIEEYIRIYIFILLFFLINFSSVFFMFIVMFSLCVALCVRFLCVCWLLVELVRKKPKCRLTASQHSEGSFFSRLARSSPKRNMQMSARQHTHIQKHSLPLSLALSFSRWEQRVFISATWARGVREREREKAQKVYVAIALQWPHID